MTARFITKTLKVKTSNGLDDTLLEPLVFERSDGTLVRAPSGSTTDGLSVPRCIQNIIPATGGDWFSGVLHDAAYRGQLEMQVEDTAASESAGLCWKRCAFSQEMCDELILEAMTAQGVGRLLRMIIFTALRWFGWKAFSEDRRALLRGQHQE